MKMNNINGRVSRLIIQFLWPPYLCPKLKRETNIVRNCILNTVLPQNYFLKNSVVKNATEL